MEPSPGEDKRKRRRRFEGGEEAPKPELRAEPEPRARASPPNTSVLQIPNDPAVPFLTSTIYELESTSGAKLSIEAPAGGSASGAKRTVTITGSAEAQRRCAQMVLSRAFSLSLSAMKAPAPPAVPPAAPPGYETLRLRGQEALKLKLEIPNDATVSFLIGAKGASIMAMQEEAFCRVEIQKTSDVPVGAATRTVTISGGTAEGRARCAELVRTRVAECQQIDRDRQKAAGAREAQSLVVDVPNDSTVNFIIGKGGASIRELQEQTGTRVTIQKASEVNPGAPHRVVTVIGGTAEQRELCAALLRHKIFEHRSRLDEPPETRRARAMALGAMGALAPAYLGAAALAQDGVLGERSGYGMGMEMGAYPFYDDMSGGYGAAAAGGYAWVGAQFHSTMLSGMGGIGGSMGAMAGFGGAGCFGSAGWIHAPDEEPRVPSIYLRRRPKGAGTAETATLAVGAPV